MTATPAPDLIPEIRPGRGGARPNSGRKPKDPNGTDPYSILAKAKAQHEVHRAKLAELEYKAKVRELIPVDEVAQAWSEQVTIAKNRLLSLPSRVSSDVLRLKTQREIERVLKDAVIDILEELANGASIA
mgnify:CR=1 FL=1